MTLQAIASNTRYPAILTAAPVSHGLYELRRRRKPKLPCLISQKSKLWENDAICEPPLERVELWESILDLTTFARPIHGWLVTNLLEEVLAFQECLVAAARKRPELEPPLAKRYDLTTKLFNLASAPSATVPERELAKQRLFSTIAKGVA